MRNKTKVEPKKLSIDEAKNIVVTCDHCKREFRLGEGYSHSYVSGKYLCLNCIDYLKEL